jgi:hypothetical protein
MFEQTPINRLNGMNWEHNTQSDRDHENREMNGVKQLLADVTELGELQARLIADDVRKSLTSTIKPTVFVGLCVALLIGTIPIMLLGLASLLVDKLHWTPPIAQLTCGGVALIIALGLGALAVKKFKQCASPLQRSLNELEKNLETLRDMLGKRSEGGRRS